jgi:ABC-type sugar transport system ATPase subunit
MTIDIASPPAVHAGGDAPLPRLSPAEPVLQVSTAVKRFGAVTALDGVDLEVGRGEIVALLGASGCGKTTLLRGIAGLATFDSGEVRLLGTSIGHIAPASRDIAMVFQDGALFPHLSVERNIAAGLRPGASRAAITPVAQLLHIDGLLTRKPHELSGGQRQRVGIARALVRRPRLMLMDEPFAALDADLRLELRRELRRLHEIGELAETVFVTHDQTEALGIADRIAVMSGGRIVQQGTPSELLDRPAELSIARFLGVPRIAVLPELDGTILAVRPTDLRVVERPGKTTTGLTAEISTVSAEPFAGGWLVSGRTAEGTTLEVVTEWGTPRAPGDLLTLQGTLADMHAFDAATGARQELEPRRLREIWGGVTR